MLSNEIIKINERLVLIINVKFYKSKVFNWINDKPINWTQPFKKMAKTSYFLKAEKRKQKSNFMIFKKKI